MKKRPCLVVGGGPIALRKVENLLDYSAHVTVVAPKVHDALEYHAQRGRIVLEKREYRSPEAADYGVVISASDDKALNRRVYDDAKGGGALVNVVDDPPHCDFTFPAVLSRNCLTVAIATDGKAPFMAGHLRLILDNVFPEHWERLMGLAGEFRGRVRRRWPQDHARQNRCYADFLEADWRQMIGEMNDEEIERELERMLEQGA